MGTLTKLQLTSQNGIASLLYSSLLGVHHLIGTPQLWLSSPQRMSPSSLPTGLSSSCVVTAHTILKLSRQCSILRVGPSPLSSTEGPRAEWSVLCRQLLRSLFWPLYFPWHKVSSSILTARYCYLSSSCDGPDPSWCTRIRAAEFFWKKSASISITTKNTKGHETYQIWRSQRICAFSC